jgi:tripartite-type tricarboxylate transporter receptor subunit TctC
MKRFQHCCVALLLAGLPLLGLAQAYPSKTVRIVNPYPAGGPLDVLARVLAERLSERLGQPFIVENKPGATGNIGSNTVARAEPDGHTLLVISDTVVTVNPAIYKKMPFDAAKAFRPIATLATLDAVLVVNPAVPAKNFAEFVSLARREKLSYASGGGGSPAQIAMELVRQQIGAEMIHVPYKGTAPVVTDLVGGQVQAALSATPGVLPHVRSGRLRALAVAGSARSPLMPEVPTLAEVGYPQATSEFAFLLMAPADTPDAVIATLEREVRHAMAAEGVRERFVQMGMAVPEISSAEAAARLRAGSAKWAKVVKDLNLSLD